MRIMPYKIASKSGKALAEALGCRRVRSDSPTFTNRANHLIVNWGGSVIPEFPTRRGILNDPVNVQTASNKLYSFRQLSANGISTPEWTTDRREALDWARGGSDVVCRHKLRGHSGDGIELYNADPSYHIIPEAPLYVKYIKKQDEYRYHVFDGRVIDIQQKRKRREVDNDEVNYQVRSSHTGWVYCRDSVVAHPSLDDMAISAVQALGLDFGAVDIIWNERRGRGYVLEVNTACGLEGHTVEVYADAIRRYERESRHPTILR